MARLDIDLSDITEEEMGQTGGWRVWPDGFYRCLIDQTDYKDTAKGDGKCLHVTLLCLDQGKQFNKTLRDFLVLEHPKEEVRRIARIRLKELALAVGHPTPDKIADSEELEGKAMMVRVYSQPADNPDFGDADGLQNRVGQYLSVEAHAKLPTKGNGKAAPAPPTQETLKPADDVPF